MEKDGECRRMKRIRNDEFRIFNPCEEFQRPGVRNIPFRIGKWLDSRLTLTGMHMRQRCAQFHDLSFDRTKWVAVASLENTFHLSSKPDLSLEINGSFQSKAIQGTFDIDPLGSVDAALKWTFAGDRASLSVRCGDIFET